jgi:dihydropteroate synthase
MKIHLSSKRVLTLEKKTKMNFTCRDFRLDLSTPKLMGVLNITPDSFSDGGRFFSNNKIDLDKAVETALQMQKDGATIIDIGGESTRPNATPVSADEEIRRTVPLIEKLAKVIEIPISIDTYKSSVAEAALKAGASLVNDISGFRLDGALADVCAKYDAPAIVMHSRQKPSEMKWSYEEKTTYADVVAEVKSALQQSIEFGKARGVKSFVVDVGFGFGKNVEANYELLMRLREFEPLGYPILVGLSRKSFIGKVLDSEAIAPVEARLYGTIAANTIAMMNGANILRVHDCKAHADAVKIFCKAKEVSTMR